MALSDRLDPTLVFRGAGGVNPVQNQASQDEKARTAMSLKESAQNIDFNKILLQQQQLAQQRAQQQQALNNTAAAAYGSYGKGPAAGAPPTMGSPSPSPTAVSGSVVGPSGLLIRPGASGPDPEPAAPVPQFKEYALSPDGHRIGSNDGQNTWFDADTGAPIANGAAATIGDTSQ